MLENRWSRFTTAELEAIHHHLSVRDAYSSPLAPALLAEIQSFLRPTPLSPAEKAKRLMDRILKRGHYDPATPEEVEKMIAAEIQATLDECRKVQDG